MINQFNRKLGNKSIVVIIFLFTTFFMVGQVQARGQEHSAKRYAPGHYYQHRHYPIGYKLKHLPAGYFNFSYRDKKYFYSNGTYYRRHWNNYVVVRPPVGALIHALPYGYRTVYFGSNIFYYANGVYYAWRPKYSTYAIVDGPDTDVEPVVETKWEPFPQDIFIYPNQGQLPEQISMDRYECYLWAVEQTGFDPGVDETGNISDYRRAQGACLEGRGYTVK